jgi:hypothetical protein
MIIAITMRHENVINSHNKELLPVWFLDLRFLTVASLYISRNVKLSRKNNYSIEKPNPQIIVRIINTNATIRNSAKGADDSCNIWPDDQSDHTVFRICATSAIVHIEAITKLSFSMPIKVYLVPAVTFLRAFHIVTMDQILL